MVLGELASCTRFSVGGFGASEQRDRFPAVLGSNSRMRGAKNNIRVMKFSVRIVAGMPSLKLLLAPSLASGDPSRCGPDGQRGRYLRERAAHSPWLIY
jgi:hypothetical protein